MGSANNPDTYGQSTTGTANQIEDGVDFPHSGIIKALSDGMGQNYAIDGFYISSTNATALTVAAGKIFRDGQFVSVSGASLTLSSTYTNGYHLLVEPSGGSPTVVLRNPSAVDKVPDITSGDTIIAVITHTGVNPCSIQFLTVHKREHSLSIGRDNSSVYTEGLTIKSNAGDIEIEALEQDKDIILKANDGGSSTEVMRVDGSTARVGIGATAPSTKLEVSGDATISRSADTGQTRTVIIEGARNATGTDYARIDLKNYDSHGPTSYVGARIAAINEATGVDDGSLIFSTADAGTLAERMRITDGGKVGVGTSSPMNSLQVSHTGADGDNGLMIVREDTTTADTDLLGGIGFDSTDGNVPSSVLEASAYIAALAAEDHGTGDKGADLTFGTAAIDENDDTVSTEHMRILSDGKVGIGIAAPEHRLHIVETTDNYPFRLRGAEGNIRINKFGHVQIQNENASDSSSIDDPIWQIGQRDGGQLDIAFGNISTQLVAGTDAIISLARASNSASGNKQIGFFGATAVNQQAAAPACPTGGAANADLNAQSINLLITALTNLGLIA